MQRCVVFPGKNIPDPEEPNLIIGFVSGMSWAETTKNIIRLTK